MKYVKVEYKYKLREIEVFTLLDMPSPVYGTIHCSKVLYLVGDDDNPNNGQMILEPGYASDASSGPTYDTKSSMRGSFGHDSGYQMLRHNLLHPFREWRAYFDEHLGIWCKEDGMWHWRANAWVKAVKKRGFNAASEQKKIYTAP